MHVKTTLILLAVAAVLGVVVLWDSRHAAQEDGKPSPYLFRDFRDDEIRSIEIVSGGRTVLLEKRVGTVEAGWEVVKPFAAAADRQSVDNILSDLRWMSSRGFVSEEEARGRGDANFGLDKPQAILTCKSPERTYALAFGAANPAKEGEVFARAEGEGVRRGVYAVDKKVLDALAKPPEELRDRTLVALEAWKADKLVLRVAKTDVELVKKDADWFIEKPEEIKEKADYTPVNAVLTTLRELRWRDWIAGAPKPEDLEAFGLKAPEARFAVSSAEAKRTESILVGAAVAKDPDKDKGVPDRRYVRRGDAGPVVTVEAAALDKLPKTVDLLRSKKIWDVQPNNLVRIALQVGAESSVLERKAGESWTFVQPPGLRADDGLVSEWVFALNGTEVELFYESAMADPRTYGFDKPDARVELTTRKRVTTTVGEGAKKETKTEEQRTSRVWLVGHVGDKVFVKREDRGQAVEIKADLLRKRLRLGARLFRSRSLVDARREDLRTVTIERTERGRADYATYACVLEGGTWAMKSPAGGVVDSQKILAAVGALYALRAGEWVLPEPAPGAYGLERPAVRVDFSWIETKEVRPEAPAGAEKEKEKKTTAHRKILSIGNWTPAKDACYARLEGDPAVFTLPKATVEALDQPMAK
jgi:hypothetical protein